MALALIVSITAGVSSLLELRYLLRLLLLLVLLLAIVHTRVEHLTTGVEMIRG